MEATEAIGALWLAVKYFFNLIGQKMVLQGKGAQCQAAEEAGSATQRPDTVKYLA